MSAWKQAQAGLQGLHSQAHNKFLQEANKSDPLGSTLGTIAGTAAGAALGGPAGAQIGGSLGGSLGGKGYLTANDAVGAGVSAAGGAGAIGNKLGGALSNQFGADPLASSGAHPLYGRYNDGGPVTDLTAISLNPLEAAKRNVAAFNQRQLRQADMAGMIDPKYAPGGSHDPRGKGIGVQVQAPAPAPAAEPEGPSLWEQASSWFGGGAEEAPAPAPAVDPSTLSPEDLSYLRAYGEVNPWQRSATEGIRSAREALGFADGGQVSDPWMKDYVAQQIAELRAAKAAQPQGLSAADLADLNAGVDAQFANVPMSYTGQGDNTHQQWHGQAVANAANAGTFAGRDAVRGFNEGGNVEPKWYDILGQFEKRRKTLTGKTDAERKANPPKYRMGGGPLMAPKGEQSFMMEHPSNFAEKVGPLAKVVHKMSGGEVYERSYHNPYAAPSQDKESAGKK